MIGVFERGGGGCQKFKKKRNVIIWTSLNSLYIVQRTYIWFFFIARIFGCSGGSNILNILPADLEEVTAEDFIMFEVKEMLLVLVDVMQGIVPGVVVVPLCSLRTNSRQATKIARRKRITTIKIFFQFLFARFINPLFSRGMGVFLVGSFVEGSQACTFGRL